MMAMSGLNMCRLYFIFHSKGIALGEPYYSFRLKQCFFEPELTTGK
jgi:hypothetical protein